MPMRTMMTHNTCLLRNKHSGAPHGGFDDPGGVGPCHQKGCRQRDHQEHCPLGMPARTLFCALFASALLGIRPHLAWRWSRIRTVVHASACCVSACGVMCASYTDVTARMPSAQRYTAHSMQLKSFSRLCLGPAEPPLKLQPAGLLLLSVQRVGLHLPVGGGPGHVVRHEHGQACDRHHRVRDHFRRENGPQRQAGRRSRRVG